MNRVLANINFFLFVSQNKFLLQYFLKNANKVIFAY